MNAAFQHCLLLTVVAVNFAVHAEDPPVAPAKSQSVANSETPVSTTLDPAWLAAAKHPVTGLVSRGVRPEESEAYFAILNHARQMPLEELKAAARRFEQQRLAEVMRDKEYAFYFREPNTPFPTFVDLYKAPEAYHGQLVTFRGHVRRLISYPPGPNAHGLQQLHEAWLYVDDAQQNPVVAVCSELPPGIPSGSDVVVDHVSVTGYFFKRYGYEDSAGRPRFAPLILAQRLEWIAPEPKRPLLAPATSFVLTVVIGLLLAIVMWRRLGTRRAKHSDIPTSDELFAGNINPGSVNQSPED